MTRKRALRPASVLLAACLALISLLFSAVPASGASNGLSAYSEPANPIITQEARNIYYYLQKTGAEKGIVVGAMDTSITSAYPNGNNYDLINQTFGVKPAMYSTRYYWTGSGFALNPEDVTASGATAAKTVNTVLYNHYKDGAILLIHPDSTEPEKVGKLLYEKGLVPAAVTREWDYDDAIVFVDKSNPNRDEEACGMFWGYVKEWADALADLESRGVGAYLFRPFVEMNMKDFYGCTPEGVEAFRNVWKQLHDYFYKERKLKGCLLTFAPADINTNIKSAEPFYPGNEYADILAPTHYTDSAGKITSAGTSNYEWMVRTGKPVGLSEFSVRTGDWSVAAGAPIGDWAYALNVLLNGYPQLSWVNTWAGSAYSLFPPDGNGNGNHNGEYFLKSPFTIMAGNLPDFKNSKLTIPGFVQFYTQKKFGGGYTGLGTVGDYSASDLKKAGVSISEIQSVSLRSGYGITLYSGPDCTGTHWPYIDSAPDFRSLKGAKDAKSLKLFELTENVAYMKDITASAGDEENIWKANDGKLSRWIVNEAPTSWLTVDLKGIYLINRWVVKHAGAADEDSVYNTSGFDLQKSDDGITWKTVSSIYGNSDNITDETVPSFEAGYVRLKINKPNSTANEKNRSCISEFEVYGTPVTLLAVSSEKPDNDKEPDIGESSEQAESEQPAPSESVGAPSGGTESGQSGSVSPTENKPEKEAGTLMPVLIISAAIVLLGAGAATFLYLRKKKSEGAAK